MSVQLLQRFQRFFVMFDYIFTMFSRKEFLIIRSRMICKCFIPNWQSCRKSSGDECIFDLYSIAFNADLTNTHSSGVTF